MFAHMRAMMLQEPERIELVELPLRPLRPGEVLLEVEACSVCGSDLEGYHGQHPKMTLPRVMGHEVASTVAEVGPGVQNLAVGDRVAGTGGTACGVCSACRAGQTDRCANPLSAGFSGHGAYAEYVIGLAAGCTPIPDDVSLEVAAVSQPAGIANHAVATRACVVAGETVLIQGCGPIGLAALMLSKLRGAVVISTDIVHYRCELAGKMGADLVLNAHDDDVPREVREYTSGRGVDKVIECVGGDQDETVAEAITCVKDGGLVAIVGSFAANRATLPVIDFKFNEKVVVGSQSMPEGYGPVFDLVRSGKLNLAQLITHRLALEELDHALRLMDTKAEQVVKIIIRPAG